MYYILEKYKDTDSSNSIVHCRSIFYLNPDSGGNGKIYSIDYEDSLRVVVWGIPASVMRERWKKGIEELGWKRYKTENSYMASMGLPVKNLEADFAMAIIGQHEWQKFPYH